MTTMLRFSRSARAATRTIEDAAFVVSVDQQLLIELNDVGTFVWSALARPMSREDLADAVVAEFEVTRHAALQDIEVFLDALVSRGVVVAQEVDG